MSELTIEMKLTAPDFVKGEEVDNASMDLSSDIKFDEVEDNDHNWVMMFVGLCIKEAIHEPDFIQAVVEQYGDKVLDNLTKITKVESESKGE